MTRWNRFLQWAWSLLPDNCEMPNCSRLGVRGNENIIDGKVMCDNCSVAHDEREKQKHA